MKRMGLLIAIAVCTFSADAFAQKSNQSRFRGNSAGTNAPARKSVPASPDKDHNLIREDGKLVIYKKKNVVDFDDSLIEGEVRNPSEFYFVHRPEEKFNSLVQRRKNFQKEMLRDTVMIR